MGLEKFTLSFQLRTLISKASRIDEIISYTILAIEHREGTFISSTCLNSSYFNLHSSPTASIVNTFPQQRRTQKLGIRVAKRAIL